MQGNKLYVGNLDSFITSKHLKELFSNFGEITQVNVVKGKGFGFIEMSKVSEAEEAKRELNNYNFKGRLLSVNKPIAGTVNFFV